MNTTLNSDPLVPASVLSSSALSETKIDLLWRSRQVGSASFGYNVLWKMEDTARSDFTILNAVPDANWQIVGVADANQDGVGDFLWRNSVSGVNVWWYMDHQGKILQSTLIQQVEDVNWTIVGVGDQNNDGQVDILWRNATTGQNLWWLMQGTEIKSFQSITSLVSTDWEIKGVGDVNQDGQLDVFWSNRTTEKMVWWVMEGGQNSSKSFLIEVETNGSIAIGVADFNNDKSPDIVLRNYSTGANTLLIMDGGTVIDRYTLETVDPTWDIVGLIPRVETPRLSVPAALSSPTDAINLDPNASAKFFKRDQVSQQTIDRLYTFNVKESGLITANLTGLTGDADVRLIQDSNGNGSIDAGESILAWQWERGTTRESLRRFVSAGNYLLQVSRYGQQTAQYSLSSNFTPMASDPNKFNLLVNFGTGTERLNQAAKDSIVSASKFWESVILERSAITQFKDLTLTVLGEAQTLSTLAVGAPLVSTRNNSLFLVGGEAVLNTQRYDLFNSDPNYLRSVMIHEFAHALGFGTIWEPIEFPTLKQSIGRSFVNRTSKTYNGNTYAGYAYGDLLGQFGQGIAVPIDEVFAHWSESVFDQELMTPVAEVSGVTMPLSALTISSLRDLGWKVNYGAAQAYGLPQPIVATTPQPTLLLPASNPLSTPENKIALQESELSSAGQNS
jgi:FG-GAP-like repeat/Leishmanolysin